MGILSSAGITQQIVIDRDVFFYILAQAAVFQVNIQTLGFVDRGVSFQQMVFIGRFLAGINNDPCVVGVGPEPQIFNGSPAAGDGIAGARNRLLFVCLIAGAVPYYRCKISAFAF